MKKSIKNFLIISQVLGWSALVASACTDDQTKTTAQNSNENASKNASTQYGKSSESVNPNTDNKDQVNTNMYDSTDKSTDESMPTTKGDNTDGSGTSKDSGNAKAMTEDEKAKPSMQKHSPSVGEEKMNASVPKAESEEEGGDTSMKENGNSKDTSTHQMTDGVKGSGTEEPSAASTSSDVSSGSTGHGSTPGSGSPAPSTPPTASPPAGPAPAA